MSKNKVYFADVEIGDKVQGLVFGKGIVVNVFETEGFYQFEVEFINGHNIYYTSEGVPNWGSFNEQTLYYKKDIDTSNFDFTGNENPLSFKKIIKLKDSKKDKLEIKMPSGIWDSLKKADSVYVEQILERGMLFLIREVK